MSNLIVCLLLIFSLLSCSDTQSNNTNSNQTNNNIANQLKNCCEQCNKGLEQDVTAVGPEAIDCLNYAAPSSNIKLDAQCKEFFKQRPTKASECILIIKK